MILEWRGRRDLVFSLAKLLAHELAGTGSKGREVRGESLPEVLELAHVHLGRLGGEGSRGAEGRQSMDQDGGLMDGGAFVSSGLASQPVSNLGNHSGAVAGLGEGNISSAVIRHSKSEELFCLCSDDILFKKALDGNLERLLTRTR